MRKSKKLRHIEITEDVVRGEMFSVERMEEYAIFLAENIQVSSGGESGQPLLKKMASNGKCLVSLYRSLSEAALNKENIFPAAEWFVDNFHIIEEQLNEIKKDFPESYYKELPKVIGKNFDQELNGYPRVYAMALGFMAHTDSQLNGESLLRFFWAFQTKSFLCIGELWAISITLRLALIENIRRVAMRILWDHTQRNSANSLADQIESAVHDPVRFQRYVSKIRTYGEANVELHCAFFSQLACRLRDQQEEIFPASEALVETLLEKGFTTESLVNFEHQHQASNQVTIANIISSMRLIANMDWQKFFERVSPIDVVLSKDPTKEYSELDFLTRDRYRHSIERIGKHQAFKKSILSSHCENEIAQKALELAEEKKKHIGYYLVEPGVFELEKHFNYSPVFREKILRSYFARPTLYYFLFIIIFDLLLMSSAFIYGTSIVTNSIGIFLISIFIFLPCTEISISVLNFFLAKCLQPKALLKFEFIKGVPHIFRTLVVIPSMIVDEKTVNYLLEKLEIHYLGNSEDEIYFSLATDLVDANSEELASDQLLVSHVVEGVRKLNEKYSYTENEHFLLFHRHRQWNSVDGKWMGWERKRGKLHELNQLLRGREGTSFKTLTKSSPEFLSTFKYIITLDADTKLPRDTAKKLIGTASHPLNRPQLDSSSGLVSGGYGIIQPRISISIESSSQSFFSKIFSGHTGVDPYTTAVSNVYQDSFGEGIYTGKGIYDIDAFEAALKNKAPENLILSHDLFEGLFARPGLATDIELIDDYPKTYTSFFTRQHRWVRGDWQICSWLWTEPSLPLIARWKILDNLRRSLLAPSIFFLFIAGWTILPGSIYFWTALGMLVIILPAILHISNSLIVYPRSMTWTQHLTNVVDQAITNAAQIGLSFIFLPHQVFIHLDAIFRALYRMLVSKKNLLEWTTSAQADSEGFKKGKAFWQSTWPIEGLLVALFLLVSLKVNLETELLAGSFIFVWAFFPQIEKMVNRGIHKKIYAMSSKENEFLLDISRRIWHFFEVFVGADDNWLPPDNFQEDPEAMLARRTSPTNIGLYLLSLLSAKDLGYLTPRNCILRCQLTLETLKKAERFEGHFYNWYDTGTLEPLYPKYISLVDSGNLAGYLLVIKQYCLEFREKEELLHPAALQGLQVTLRIIQKESHSLPLANQVLNSFSYLHLLKHIKECIEILNSSNLENLCDWYLSLSSLRRGLEEVRDCLKILSLEQGERYFKKTTRWLESAFLQIESLQKDLFDFTPWVQFPFAELTKSINEIMPKLTVPWQALLEQLFGSVHFSKMQETMPENVLSLQNLISKLREEENLSPEFMENLMLQFQVLYEFLIDSTQNLDQFFVALEDVHHLTEKFFTEMNFEFLLNKERQVFSIGYNVVEARHDGAFYDLLASESRLASFVAIAKGDISQKHWFRLGRQLVPVEGRRALISWSASMFEYLMPQLVMKSYENTLLDETLLSVVARQISYGKNMKVPWGISEAGYNARDVNFSYQYGPFGIPGLGLKRGLAHDLVVSPYSSFLAAQVNLKKSLQNLRKFEDLKILGCFGFYEAIDYTPERIAEGQDCAVIKSYMAHHQGMSLVAIDNILNKNIMQSRFHSEMRVKATQLLLQERVPYKVTLNSPRAAETEELGPGRSLLHSISRDFDEGSLHTSRLQILSNGKYSVMINTMGTGYSKLENQALSRWKEDALNDNWGNFIYIKQLEKKSSDQRKNQNQGQLQNQGQKVWSSTYKPFLREPTAYKVTLTEAKVDFKRADGDILTHTQVIVASEDDVEIRHVKITNNSAVEQEFEVTSYTEPILTSFSDDQAHPCFSNLFIETEYISERQALLAKRRPRSSLKKEVWALHVVSADRPLETEVQYETDRARFIGRGKKLQNPYALNLGQDLSNTVGSTLDPIFSMRVRVKLSAGKSLQVAFASGMTGSREEALRLIDKYHDISSFDHEAKLAWTKSRIDLRHLGLNSETAHLFQNLAEKIIYADTSLRLPSQVLAASIREQSSLWRYGIGGDLPILTVVINDKKDIGLVRKILRGHEYLRSKGVIFDLVLLNSSKTSYLQDLQDELIRQVRLIGAQNLIDKAGGIFVHRMDLMGEGDHNLIQALSRVVLSPERGSLKDQLSRKSLPENFPEKFMAPNYTSSDIAKGKPADILKIPELLFFNGLGGFSKDGREYTIVLEASQNTPAPWINVIANPVDFGFQVSESGSGYTWSQNSRENRLSVWSNDPVCDPPSEIFYLRDEENGDVWTPTALPVRDPLRYIIRHGLGYSVFEHQSHGLQQELTQFVAMDESIKISHLRLINKSSRPRRITLTAYIEWVLSSQKEKSTSYVQTELDAESGALFARNSYNQEFSQRISFFDILSEKSSFTCDRKEFLGPNADYIKPDGLRRQGLSGRKGIGLDPCAAIQSLVEIAPFSDAEFVVLLGQSDNEISARTLVKKYKNLDQIEKAYKAMNLFWSAQLGRIQVKTPDPSFDIMMNSWLLYQTLVCRMWARSAFYQSGGAYGFRDQLQDSMALIYSSPELVRQHILKAASRQFPEGDVQHWWHPPTGRGVRTHFSDDLLWLPFVVSQYMKVTGDVQILDEEVSFIEAPLLQENQEDSYDQPTISLKKLKLQEHCFLALDRSLKLGQHGLPLIGGGDWNDGFNRIGEKGLGESVWLAWFLYKVLNDFLPHCLTDEIRTQNYTNHMNILKLNIEKNAWDGDWYLRAFFDDGTPLGSNKNEECKIDSLSQSWSVLSGAGAKDRQIKAMESVSENLILNETKDFKNRELILLFKPPFDRSAQDPGYVKGYVPGVRENGGQYTHAAIWVLMAFAKLGNGEKANELFRILNPIHHALEKADVQRYKIEPYVIAADIYAVEPHVGRGGWSWYTGSASWFYRAGLESILGFELTGEWLCLNPCLPKSWNSFEIDFRFKSSMYRIRVVNKTSAEQKLVIEAPGLEVLDSKIRLKDDEREYSISIVTGFSDQVHVGIEELKSDIQGV
jgi:cyclic beta-1,2-glucan synthetase